MFACVVRARRAGCGVRSPRSVRFRDVLPPPSLCVSPSSFRPPSSFRSPFSSLSSSQSAPNLQSQPKNHPYPPPSSSPQQVKPHEENEVDDDEVDDDEVTPLASWLDSNPEAWMLPVPTPYASTANQALYRNINTNVQTVRSQTASSTRAPASTPTVDSKLDDVDVRSIYLHPSVDHLTQPLPDELRWFYSDDEHSIPLLRDLSQLPIPVRGSSSSSSSTSSLPSSQTTSPRLSSTTMPTVLQRSEIKNVRDATTAVMCSVFSRHVLNGDFSLVWLAALERHDSELWVSLARACVEAKEYAAVAWCFKSLASTFGKSNFFSYPPRVVRLFHRALMAALCNVRTHPDEAIALWEFASSNQIAFLAGFGFVKEAMERSNCDVGGLMFILSHLEPSKQFGVVSFAHIVEGVLQTRPELLDYVLLMLSAYVVPSSHPEKVQLRASFGTVSPRPLPSLPPAAPPPSSSSSSSSPSSSSPAAPLPSHSPLQQSHSDPLLRMGRVASAGEVTLASLECVIRGCFVGRQVGRAAEQLIAAACKQGRYPLARHALDVFDTMKGKRLTIKQLLALRRPLVYALAKEGRFDELIAVVRDARRIMRTALLEQMFPVVRLQRSSSSPPSSSLPYEVVPVDWAYESSKVVGGLLSQYVSNVQFGFGMVCISAFNGLTEYAASSPASVTASLTPTAFFECFAPSNTSTTIGDNRKSDPFLQTFGQLARLALRLPLSSSQSPQSQPQPQSQSQSQSQPTAGLDEYEPDQHILDNQQALKSNSTAVASYSPMFAAVASALIPSESFSNQNDWNPSSFRVPPSQSTTKVGMPTPIPKSNPSSSSTDQQSVITPLAREGFEAFRHLSSAMQTAAMAPLLRKSVADSVDVSHALWNIFVKCGGPVSRMVLASLIEYSLRSDHTDLAVTIAARLAGSGPTWAFSSPLPSHAYPEVDSKAPSSPIPSFWVVPSTGSSSSSSSSSPPSLSASKAGPRLSSLIFSPLSPSEVDVIRAGLEAFPGSQASLTKAVNAFTNAGWFANTKIAISLHKLAMSRPELKLLVVAEPKSQARQHQQHQQHQRHQHQRHQQHQQSQRSPSSSSPLPVNLWKLPRVAVEQTIWGAVSSNDFQEYVGAIRSAHFLGGLLSGDEVGLSSLKYKENINVNSVWETYWTFLVAQFIPGMKMLACQTLLDLLILHYPTDAPSVSLQQQMLMQIKSLASSSPKIKSLLWPSLLAEVAAVSRSPSVVPLLQDWFQTNLNAYAAYQSHSNQNQRPSPRARADAMKVHEQLAVVALPLVYLVGVHDPDKLPELVASMFHHQLIADPSMCEWMQVVSLGQNGSVKHLRQLLMSGLSAIHRAGNDSTLIQGQLAMVLRQTRQLELLQAVVNSLHVSGRSFSAVLCVQGMCAIIESRPVAVVFPRSSSPVPSPSPSASSASAAAAPVRAADAAGVADVADNDTVQAQAMWEELASHLPSLILRTPELMAVCTDLLSACARSGDISTAMQVLALVAHSTPASIVHVRAFDTAVRMFHKQYFHTDLRRWLVSVSWLMHVWQSFFQVQPYQVFPVAIQLDIVSLNIDTQLAQGVLEAFQDVGVVHSNHPLHVSLEQRIPFWSTVGDILHGRVMLPDHLPVNPFSEEDGCNVNHPPPLHSVHVVVKAVVDAVVHQRGIRVVRDSELGKVIRQILPKVGEHMFE